MIVLTGRRGPRQRTRDSSPKKWMWGGSSLAARDPPVPLRMVLLDEPASGVNPALAHRLFSHIVKVKQELGVTFFIIEHRLEIATRYVDYVYAMAQGKVISKGSADEVLNDPAVIEGYLGG